MRIILDTNILLSALLGKNTAPDSLYEAWKAGAFTLLTCHVQLDELRRVTRRPNIKQMITPAEAGRMINDLRSLATVVEPLPEVDVSPDPFDNFLLALAQSGHADILVTGDKRGLLQLGTYGGTRILTASQAALLLAAD